ncbi:MAG TPA: MFS transporter [Xanthobacteraceae bacterium]|nr:MFS transporter [Xanthobacteraceae bacterium]
MTPDDQFSLLRHGQYRIYFATRVATALGYQMLFVAVGWQVYDLTNSALDLGLVGLLLFIPSVPGTLLVGHVADHYDRRWVIRLAQIGKAIGAAVLTVGSVTGTLSVYVIFSTVLAIGFCRAFDTPTLHTLVPGIVPKEMISRAVAGGSMANQLATIGGPVLGGILYIFGPEVVYGLCFAAFITASGLVGFIRLSYPPREKKPITLETVFAGFTYLRQNRIIFGAVSLDLCVIMLGGVIALLPVYARDILETGPWGLGLLRSAPAVGALIATIFLTRATLRRNSGKLIISALCIYGFTVLVFGISNWLPLSLAALMVYGAMDTLNAVIRQSMIQSRTPNDKLGRVMSVSSMFTSSASTLGQFESGVMAAIFGVVPSVLIGGIGAIAIALLWIRVFPELWRVQGVVPEKEDVAAR